MTSAFVVGRRRKGRRIRRLVRQVRADLRSAGWKVDATTVRRKRGLRRAAGKAARKVDVVVAVGGDGAVGQVATSLAGTDAALGIVPAGTGNLLATNLGIPKRRQQATRAIITGRRRRIDLGRVTLDGSDHDFAVACGVGFDAGVVAATGDRQKLRWGRLAYLANALGRAGNIHNVRHSVTLDGVQTTTDAAQVFIANFGKLLPLVEPRQPVRPDDGWFDVLMVRASGPLPALQATWEVMTREDLGSDSDNHVIRARAREVRVETEPQRLVEADGNVIGATPLVARVLPGALTVVAPRR